MPLTKRAIDSTKYDSTGKSVQVLWDGTIPGFGCRIYPSGKKSFIVRYATRSGRDRLMTLGKYGVLTLDEARERARKNLVEVSDGGDPLSDRRADKRGLSVKELGEIYLERYAKVEKKSWQEDKRRLKTRIYTSSIGNHSVLDIRRPDISALHAKIGQSGKYEANRILALLKVMFNKAVEWGYLPDNHPNPAVGIKHFKEKSRDRYLKPEEIPRLVEAINKESSIYVKSAFWLLLLTGMRKSELLSAKWEDVDLNRKELRIEDTKAGRTHYVPLSEPVLQILNAIPLEHDNPYILPGARPGQHLVSINRPWERIRKKAKLEDVRLHDLRRTVGSWMAQSGESLQLIGKVLNHSNIQTDACTASK